MTRLSYSASVKEALTGAEIKKKCCKHTYSDTLKYFDKNTYTEFALQDVLDRVKCEKCQKEFLSAVFISRGSITDPEKRNHLDFSFSNEHDADTVEEVLRNIGFSPKHTMRREKHVLYFKDNDTIGDLLAYLGATKAAFDVMNSKIVKEIRNNANRLVNCDTANIEKVLNASQKYVDAIDFIKLHGGLDTLPSELYEAAKLRIDFPQASLNELALKSNPPITKSGMKHRLEKLLSAADELKTRL